MPLPHIAHIKRQMVAATGACNKFRGRTIVSRGYMPRYFRNSLYQTFARRYRIKRRCREHRCTKRCAVRDTNLSSETLQRASEMDIDAKLLDSPDKPFMNKPIRFFPFSGIFYALCQRKILFSRKDVSFLAMLFHSFARCFARTESLIRRSNIVAIDTVV